MGNSISSRPGPLPPAPLTTRPSSSSTQKTEDLFPSNERKQKNAVSSIHVIQPSLATVASSSQAIPQQDTLLPAPDEAGIISSAYQNITQDNVCHLHKLSKGIVLDILTYCPRDAQMVAITAGDRYLSPQRKHFFGSCIWGKIPQEGDRIPHRSKDSQDHTRPILKTLTLHSNVDALPATDYLKEFLFELDALTLNFPKLSFNDFDKLLPIIQSAKHLKKLHIIYPELGTIPEKFWPAIAHVTELSLDIKNVHELNITGNTQLPQLTTLRIHSTALQNIPNYLWNVMPNIQNLALHSTNLRSLGLPSNIQQPLLPQLETLEITSPRMDRLPTEFWHAFSNVTRLRLNLINTPLQNIPPPANTPPLLSLTELQLERDATRNILQPIPFPATLCNFAPNLQTLVLIGIYNLHLESLSTLLSSIPHLTTFKTNSHLSSYAKFALTLTEKNEGEGKIRFEPIVIQK